ncbi:MAG: glycosyltransferase family 39 protein [Lachnospiraceae bacterium]|nr:glycosyltransferase family 39 protein [Lachnospiraceae bacterium]
MSAFSKRKELIIIILVFGFFIFTMVHGLMHSPLWGDEWFEYYCSQSEILSGRMNETINYTFQPPLYNYVMHLWLMISTDHTWFRMFNIFIGVGSGAFLLGTVSRLCDRETSLVSLVALACCYEWVYCTQECSEYALMVFCLFAALFFYVRSVESFSYPDLAGFILSCVGAIYSQYGSVFIVAPLLIIFYFSYILTDRIKTKQKLILTLAYLLSAVSFALPLWLFFLRHQMANQELSDNTVKLSLHLCKGIFVTLGRVIGYLFSLNIQGGWETFWGLFTIVLFVFSLILIFDKRIKWTGSSLIICMWTGYFIHYFLVRMQIYGMIHPGESAGFYYRYSYFYIPIVFTVLPMMIRELLIWDRSRNYRGFLYATVGIGALCMFLSLYSLMGNWEKSLDDKYAMIWSDHKGWEDTTYLFGAAHYGFDYYLQALGYDETYRDDSIIEPDADATDLPDSFWMWRSNWGQQNWTKMMDKATMLGYDIEIYDDSGDAGQLAYCTLNQP